MNRPELTFTLPVPPSLNALYANVGKRRVKTRVARRWHRDASWLMKLEAGGRRIEGPWAVGVVLPRSMKADPDNRLKAVLDAAVASGVVCDDRHCVSVTVERSGETSEAIVTLMSATNDHVGRA
jgi:Holliday junction resolvase RusA-like endonuclease